MRPRLVAHLFSLATCLVLWAGHAAAAPALVADFDGDGLHDRATLDVADPSVVHVWLSGSGATALVRGPEPLFRLVAADLDGDHRDELVARGERTGLMVWTARHQNPGLTHFPRQPRRDSLSLPPCLATDDGPGEDCQGQIGDGRICDDCVGRVLARAPAPQSCGHAGAAPAPGPSSSFCTPVAPRPPPATA